MKIKESDFTPEVCHKIVVDVGQEVIYLIRKRINEQVDDDVGGKNKYLLERRTILAVFSCVFIADVKNAENSLAKAEREP